MNFKTSSILTVSIQETYCSVAVVFMEVNSFSCPQLQEVGTIGLGHTELDSLVGGILLFLEAKHGSWTCFLLAGSHFPEDDQLLKVNTQDREEF